MKGTVHPLVHPLLVDLSKTITPESAHCDECFGQALKCVQDDRRNIDAQRKTLEQKLSNSYINEEY